MRNRLYTMLFKRKMPCPYCGAGVMHLKGFDKEHNDIDDVEMGFPDSFYRPEYKCDNCGVSKVEIL